MERKRTYAERMALGALTPIKTTNISGESKEVKPCTMSCGCDYHDSFGLDLYCNLTYVNKPTGIHWAIVELHIDCS